MKSGRHQPRQSERDSQRGTDYRCERRCDQPQLGSSEDPEGLTARPSRGSYFACAVFPIANNSKLIFLHSLKQTWESVKGSSVFVGRLHYPRAVRTHCTDSQPAPPHQALEGWPPMLVVVSLQRNTPLARTHVLVTLHGFLNIGEAVLSHSPVSATDNPQSSRGSCLVTPQCASHRTTSYRH